jgi:dipeptidyl-peptidase 4
MSYPLQLARTRRFTLGAPRDVTIVGGPEALQVLFLRSDDPEDPVNHLWTMDPTTGRERRLVDARALAADDADLPAAERARRERVREQAGGITAYSHDRIGRRVAFAVAGRLHVLELADGACRSVDVADAAAVYDPQLAPDGRRVAVHHDDGVSIIDLEVEPPRARRLIEEPGVCWGRAEFIAAEEMGRTRGMWWSPDGTRLALTRVDESMVSRTYLVDPSRPLAPPTPLAYPFAGGANARVTLHVFDVVDAGRVDVDLGDVGADDEYLATVRWDVEPLLVGVQPRDQRALHVLAVDAASGQASTLRRIGATPWVELVAGVPALVGRRLVTVEDVGERRALCLDGIASTPEDVQVRAVLGVHRGSDASVATIVVSVSGDDPTSSAVMLVRLDDDQVGLSGPLRDGQGLHHAILACDERARPVLVVHRWSDLEQDGSTVSVERVTAEGSRDEDGRDGSDVMQQHVIASRSAVPQPVARPRMMVVGERALRTALLLPAAGTRHASEQRLPVVLDPYGGPHAQRVLSARVAFHGSQWLADQGFAVLVTDGRGTPGRGPTFEHAVHGDLAGAALEDQLAALDAVAALEPRLDLARVGIRGWSYGGTLAALAAVRRPDRFRAAVIGAPVIDWRLYDTHYTERYLGTPEEWPDAYERSNVVGADGGLVARGRSDQTPRLLIVHGMADDNVLAVHSLRLTEALLAAGIDFTFLPLTDATHMASDPAVAARLLEAQARFLVDVLRGPQGAHRATSSITLDI